MVKSIFSKINKSAKTFTIVFWVIFLCVSFFHYKNASAQLASGLFINSIEDEGDGTLSIDVNIAPTYLDATTNLVSNGIAYATVPSPKIIYIDASTSQNFTNSESASYTVASGDIPLLSNGDIAQDISFPKSVLDQATPYYFRLRVGTFYSSSVSFEPSSKVSTGDFTIIGCGNIFGEEQTITSTSVSLPCKVVGESAGAHPVLKAEYGKSGTFDLLYTGSNVFNSILNQDEEKVFSVDISGLEANTSYAFRLVDAGNKEVFSDDYTFTTTSDDDPNTNNTIPGNTGSQYGAGDDTDFNSEEYKQSLVKCNGTPTDPCRFSDLGDLISRLIKYLIVMILPISAILFAYAGFLYLTGSGSPETKTKVRSMLMKGVWGIVLVLAAWLIVKTIFWALGVEPGSDVNYLDYTNVD